MRDQYINSGQGFIIVYSITARRSFETAGELRDKILQVRGFAILSWGFLAAKEIRTSKEIALLIFFMRCNYSCLSEGRGLKHIFVAVFVIALCLTIFMPRLKRQTNFL